MIIQFCGLSGSGKTTLANMVKEQLRTDGIRCEVIDGDVYRKMLCPDLGFSKPDRNENIRRLAFVANVLASQGIIAIICAINPYDDVRQEISMQYNNVKTVFIDCGLETLIARDTKKLYQRALLADGHPDKIYNLTGVNDPFDAPTDAHLVLKTDVYNVHECADRLYKFTVSQFEGIYDPLWETAEK